MKYTGVFDSFKAVELIEKEMFFFPSLKEIFFRYSFRWIFLRLYNGQINLTSIPISFNAKGETAHNITEAPGSGQRCYFWTDEKYFQFE